MAPVAKAFFLSPHLFGFRNTERRIPNFSAKSRRMFAVGLLTMLLRRLWTDDRGQDIAEYAVMLAVILVLVVGTIRLVGSNANNAFSAVASSIQ